MGHFLLRPAAWDYDTLTNCGEDVWINQNTYIRYPELAKLGNHVALDWGFYCTTQLKIGDYVHSRFICLLPNYRTAMVFVGNCETQI